MNMVPTAVWIDAMFSVETLNVTWALNSCQRILTQVQWPPESRRNQGKLDGMYHVSCQMAVIVRHMLRHNGNSIRTNCYKTKLKLKLKIGCHLEESEFCKFYPMIGISTIIKALIKTTKSIGQ